MRKTLAFRPAGQFEVTLGSASEAFRLRCFFGFLARERLIPQNPIQLGEKPRVERKLIRPLSMDQVRLLLAQCNQKRYDQHRLRTVMSSS